MSTEDHLDGVLSKYPDTLTPDEVAEVMRVSQQTVRAQLVAGELPGIKLSRTWVVLKSELRDFLAPRHNIAIPKEGKPDER